MSSTSQSLLERLGQGEHQEAWERFVEIYAPLIFFWGRSHGLSPADAAELVQEVMALLVVKLPQFRYDPARRFRSWLRKVTLNTARNMVRRQVLELPAGKSARLDQLEAEGKDPFEEREYRAFVVRRALELMQRHFQPTTWRACWEHVVQGRSAAEVAHELGISVNAVYIAKCRVLRRLRQELQGLLE